MSENRISLSKSEVEKLSDIMSKFNKDHITVVEGWGSGIGTNLSAEIEMELYAFTGVFKIVITGNEVW